MTRLQIVLARVCRHPVAPGLVAAGLALAGCANAPAVPATAREAAAPTEVLGCAALDELACLDAALCTLLQNADKAYFCAPAADECERGFLQRAGREEDCAAGCSFTPARCYCAPDVTCVCGGGPPALCTAAGRELEGASSSARPR